MVELERVEDMMGTAISLQIADPLPGPVLRWLADDVFDWLHDVDRRFSTFIGDSEVCRLDHGELDITDCSTDVRDVLDTCATLWRDTDGYFDPYAAGRLDPSSYVKGWSVQVASDRLMAAGAVNHCINAGGDVRVRGGPEPGQDWRIGIRHPWQADQVCWVLAGTDLAVATSGTYERGGLVVDPYRGESARDLCSVTVVGADLGVADAYSTAALAMGMGGLDWLSRNSSYESAVVTDDGLCFHSEQLPVVLSPAEPGPDPG